MSDLPRECETVRFNCRGHQGVIEVKLFTLPQWWAKSDGERSSVKSVWFEELQLVFAYIWHPDLRAPHIQDNHRPDGRG